MEPLLTQQAKHISTQLKQNADHLTKTVKKMLREEWAQGTGSPKMPAANLGGKFDQAAKKEPASLPTVDKESAGKDEHFFGTLFQQMLL